MPQGTQKTGLQEVIIKDNIKRTQKKRVSGKPSVSASRLEKNAKDSHIRVKITQEEEAPRLARFSKCDVLTEDRQMQKSLASVLTQASLSWKRIWNLEKAE